MTTIIIFVVVCATLILIGISFDSSISKLLGFLGLIVIIIIAFGGLNKPILHRDIQYVPVGIILNEQGGGIDTLYKFK